jgi:hypothetical protein
MDGIQSICMLQKMRYFFLIFELEFYPVTRCSTFKSQPMPQKSKPDYQATLLKSSPFAPISPT